MGNKLIIFLLAIGLSLITVAGDVLIKKASLREAFSGWKLLSSGTIIFALTALGWFFLTRHAKLSILSVIYGVTCIVFLTLISIFYFKEKINPIEIIGIVMGIISLVLLYRFA